MANVKDLTKALNNVYLNGLITECVVKVEDEVVSISAMDMTSALFIQTTAKLEIPDTELGIGEVPLFIKMLSNVQGEEVAIKQKDNRLTFKPDKATLISYLLSEVDLIPTYDSEWTGEEVTGELSKYDGYIDLSENNVPSLLNMIGILGSASITLEVDKKGKVLAKSGSESSHKLTKVLGASDSLGECSVEVLSKHLSSVLSAIDFTQEPKMYLKENESVIITTNVASWMLLPISSTGTPMDDEDNE